MSNSNDDRRPGQQDQAEKGSKGQEQQGSGPGKSSGGQQGGQSHPGGQQGGKDPKGGQARQGTMNDDHDQGTDRANEARRKGGRSE
ncbi:MAG: hypothetical protein ACLPWG_17735 [Steroidobacteraceae bacterium]